MLRKFAFGLFLLLTALSVIFALRDEKNVTTSSDEAYQNYRAGIDLIDRFQFRQAAKELEQAVALDSNFALAQGRLAQAYGLLGFSQKSKEMWARAQKSKPHVSERERLLLDVWTAAGERDRDKFYALVEEYVRKYPKDLEGCINLAQAEYGKQNWEKALELFQQALKIDPSYAPAYNMLGYINYSMGRYDDALEALAKYIQLSPNQPNPHDSRGEILNAIGRYEEAIAEFREAFNISPEFDFAALHMADSYTSLGQVSQADYCYQLLLSQAPNEVKRNQYLIAWGRSQIYRRNFDSAVVLLREAIARDTTAGMEGAIDASYMIGYAAYLRRDLPALTANWDEFSQMYSRLLKSRPSLEGQPQTRRLSAYIQATLADLKGDLATASDIYQIIIDSTKTPTDNIHYRKLYAGILWRQGKTDLAKSELQKNLSINPNHAPSLILLADIFDSEGQKDAAQSYRQHVLAIWKNADTGFLPMLALQQKAGLSVAAAGKAPISD